MIFVNRRFVRDGISYLIEDVSFDMIQNRFIATAVYESDNEKIYTDVVIDRKIFSSMFDSLASTPGGQPFISEEGQVECVENLILCLRGGKDGKGKAREIQCGVLSTEIGKKGARDHRATESRRRSEATDPGSARQQAGDQRGQDQGQEGDQREIPSYFQRRDEQFGTVALQLLPVPIENMRKADLRRIDNRNKRWISATW